MIGNRIFLSSMPRKAISFPQQHNSFACISHNPFRMVSTLPKLPIFKAIAGHDPESVAVMHSASGRTFCYGDLLQDVAEAKDRLFEKAGKSNLVGQRIAFLVENSYDYIITLLSIFSTHSIAIPLCSTLPVHELQYIISHSQASILVCSKKFDGKARKLLSTEFEAKPAIVRVEKKLGCNGHHGVELSESLEGHGGMMLYTSGTTSRPKGVLLPQSVLTAQSNSLLQAWNYSPEDHLLHVLPLHHIHGTMNALIAPLVAGSTIEFLFPFNATAVWNRLGAPFRLNGKTKERVTFFTVVPTIYTRLLDAYRDLSPELMEAGRKALHPENMRLNISGSSALPTPTRKAWVDLSGGNILLERYGMTEVGMALSCGLDYADRIDGAVGWPLPDVQVRLVDTETNKVIECGQEIAENLRERDGEIQLRGPTIFKGYWRNPEATAREFVDGEDGQGPWFKTGDIAVRRVVSGAGANGQGWAQGPAYFILGRKSADIIKTGGEKVSALEVERELLSLPQISEAAVVAIPSSKWGQRVGAVIVLSPNQKSDKEKRWGSMDMRRALRDRLANYKIPQTMKIIDSIPRNAMGKINKKELVQTVFADEVSA